LRSEERRSLLRACCALAVARALRVRADEPAAEPPAEALAPPQPGDVLVYAFGARTNQPIALADVAAGAKQIAAFPMDPATRRVGDGTRLNQVIVVRIAAGALSDETRSRAADGVVAYSGVCTHTGCDVTDWVAPAQHFKCPCHESEYDPGDAARVVSGPAPWQLAALPLKVVDGVLAVAAPFVGKVGFAQPGSPSGE
jgi:Rieske Fe-S protein